jgi:hypothetical protein
MYISWTILLHGETKQEDWVCLLMRWGVLKLCFTSTTILKINMFYGIVLAFVVVVWKKLFEKSCFTRDTFSWGLFGIYICLVNIVVEIEVEQKVI